MRFRHTAAERAAAVIWLVACSALATARWWLLPLLLVPLAAVAATFRRGTDIDDDGLRVRGLVGSRRLPWDQVTGFRPVGLRRVVAVTGQGSAVRLPAVRPADLTKLTRTGSQ
jgi:hypothetical protein